MTVPVFSFHSGTLVLVENGRILWSLQVDHQLFSLAKLDVTVSGLVTKLSYYIQLESKRPDNSVVGSSQLKQ